MVFPQEVENVLIVSVVPYFLEKNYDWFKENTKKILDASKTSSFFQDSTLFLGKNQQVNLSVFLRKLDEMGYEKVLKVEKSGEFATRGGIVDVFPINTEWALRVEFLGNTVERISKLPLQISDEHKEREILKKRLKSQRFFSDLSNLKPGDYLVHLDHGVGKYEGLQKDNTSSQTFYVLEYAQKDKLYVPVGLERKLSRYIGFTEPKISRLGTQTWQRTKKKTREEAEKFARQLLQVYAKRETTLRPPYERETQIERELISSFPYQDTPDQIEAWKDIQADLEKTKPMDRIICGDVGFGKTELALRTMVKAVVSGYQAVLICPTTILAQQHFQSFKERLEKLPIKLGILSRLQSKKEQREIIKKIKEGNLDIIVGTHRLLSSDINFKNLGLLVIDDEQKFGVRQKEKLKQLRSSLDVLSLSATPIPRTLYFALTSLKNMSLIQTPPQNRLSIKTFILPFSENIVKNAISKEISRNGQVYYLHNRVETIEMAVKFLKNLFPSITINTAHGRMEEKKLLRVMDEFRENKIAVLVATTIIENGLDLPNVNTLIVADATKLGLAQAYQIKGRVGRSHRQAFAYFLYPKKLSSLARVRLEALKEAEELGSGYRIALKDLEIRGAGNILGKEQSGNINKVGLNLYCQMLSETIERLKMEKESPF